jgi:hypothetical protein
MKLLSKNEDFVSFLSKEKNRTIQIVTSFLVTGFVNDDATDRSKISESESLTKTGLALQAGHQIQADLEFKRKQSNYCIINFKKFLLWTNISLWFQKIGSFLKVRKLP